MKFKLALLLSVLALVVAACNPGNCACNADTTTPRLCHIRLLRPADDKGSWGTWVPIDPSLAVPNPDWDRCQRNGTTFEKQPAPVGPTVPGALVCNVMLNPDFTYDFVDCRFPNSDAGRAAWERFSDAFIYWERVTGIIKPSNEIQNSTILTLS